MYTKYYSENRRRDHLEDLRVDVRIILKLILKLYVIRVRTRFMCFRRGADPHEYGNEPSGSIQGGYLPKQLNEYWLLREKDSAPWRLFVSLHITAEGISFL